VGNGIVYTAVNELRKDISISPRGALGPDHGFAGCGCVRFRRGECGERGGGAGEEKGGGGTGRCRSAVRDGDGPSLRGWRAKELCRGRQVVRAGGGAGSFASQVPAGEMLFTGRGRSEERSRGGEMVFSGGAGRRRTGASEHWRDVRGWQSGGEERSRSVEMVFAGGVAGRRGGHYASRGAIEADEAARRCRGEEARHGFHGQGVTQGGFFRRAESFGVVLLHYQRWFPGDEPPRGGGCDEAGGGDEAGEFPGEGD